MKDPLSSWKYLLSRIKQFKEITNDTTRCQTMLDTGAESLLVVEKKAKIKFLLRKGELMEEELTEQSDISSQYVEHMSLSLTG